MNESKDDYIVLRRISISSNTGSRSDDDEALDRIPSPHFESVHLDRFEVAEFWQEPDVEAIAPAIPLTVITPLKKTSDNCSKLWGLEAINAKQSPYTGKGVTVALLDTGILQNHPVFSHIKIDQEDFTNEGLGDFNGHGTHCAGTIFGRSPTGHQLGVAPDVRAALIGKVLDRNGQGSTKSLFSAIEWSLKRGANVISMSLGFDFPGLVKKLEKAGMPTEYAVSKALVGYRENVQLFESLASMIIARERFFQTTILIAAAGNESRRGAAIPFTIASAPPAVSRGFVSVGAIGPSLVSQSGCKVATFSNTGVDIVAPGVNIHSAYLNKGYKTMSGTSMATPHVAGVAAMWAEKLVSEVNQLRRDHWLSRLMGSAASLADCSLDDVGAGLAQAPTT